MMSNPIFSEQLLMFRLAHLIELEYIVSGIITRNAKKDYHLTDYRCPCQKVFPKL